MDFLNQREGGMVFYQVSSSLLASVYCTVMNCRHCKRLREFEEIEISRQSCRDDCEKHGGKLSKRSRLLSGFHLRIRPQDPKYDFNIFY
jgi:hypothetical protein